jgi:hypothetical protein
MNNEEINADLNSELEDLICQINLEKWKHKLVKLKNMALSGI